MKPAVENSAPSATTEKLLEKSYLAESVINEWPEKYEKKNVAVCAV